jgi:hypothetical protein
MTLTCTRYLHGSAEAPMATMKTTLTLPMNGAGFVMPIPREDGTGMMTMEWPQTKGGIHAFWAWVEKFNARLGPVVAPNVIEVTFETPHR